MKKVKIHNSYDDWDYKDKITMHDLKLKWCSRFAWTNLFWIFSFTLLLSRDIIFTFIVFFFATLLILRLIDDHEFI